VKNSFIDKVRGRFERGLVIQEILDRMARLGIVVYPYRVYVKDLDTSDKAKYSDFADYLFRQLSSADAPAMADILTRNVPLEHLRQRFDRGDICYGVFHDDSLIGYTCVSRDACYGAMRSVLFRLRSNEAYGYDTFVHRPYRGSGIHLFMMQSCFAVLRDMGVKSLYGTVLYFNRIARAAAETMEYSVIDQRIFIRFFGLFELNPRIGVRRASDR
jgi:GNAT superfamily N-acetyltransferase